MDIGIGEHTVAKLANIHTLRESGGLGRRMTQTDRLEPERERERLSE